MLGSHTHTHFYVLVIKSLRYLLFIVKYISLVVCALSFQCHRSLALQLADWSATEAYFINFIEKCPDNNLLSVVYPGYRYQPIGVQKYYINLGERLIAKGTSFGHRMFAGLSGLPPGDFDSNNKFCNIRDFPEVMRKANIGAAPDSNYSMSIFAISTFTWEMYMLLLLGRLVLEKRLLQVTHKDNTANGLVSLLIECLYGIALVTCLVITIFGRSLFKKAKLEEDNFWVCVWEVSKIALVALVGCLDMQRHRCQSL